MPILKCPKCGREGYVPMAACDEVLHKLPYDADSEKFLAECCDCESDLQRMNDPVKWNPPNWRSADR